MPPNKQLHIVRVSRDEEMINRMISRVNEFKKEVLTNIQLLEG